ncbi:hypothetical protein PUN28_019955 [Cardiocondyla obscurior]|uniref:Uncharacterized protein n=1 Tax=Cardiocondyla obscurior TaxID=286306 RepID=A0AAW2EA72_9HYME
MRTRRLSICFISINLRNYNDQMYICLPDLISNDFSRSGRDRRSWEERFYSRRRNRLQSPAPRTMNSDYTLAIAGYRVNRPCPR